MNLPLLCLSILIPIFAENLYEPNPKFLAAAASTPSQAPVAPTCPCNTATVWLDVVFLFDASQATGESNLDNMWGFVASMLDFYTVQKTNYTGSDYYTQVGIVTYGNQATVEYPLGSVSGSDLDNIFSLTYNGDQQSNLEQGLKTANLQLQGSAHRANARQVIVVMTMDYNSGGADAPKKTADTIIHDGVIIMAYDYDPQHGGAPTQGLYEIASPGYYFMSDINGTVDSMNQAMCDANCFCLANYKPYSSVANLRQLPTDGCYVDTGITSNQRLAINRCATYNGGTLPTDKDAAKTTFLSQLVSDGQAFWLGLYYDNGGWKWSDNTTLLATDYQPWASGIPPDGSGSQTGAYFTGQLKWQGCLWPVAMFNTFVYSSYYCNTERDSLLVKDDSPGKTRHLLNMLPGASFYIGLHFDRIDGDWKWMDDSPLGDYQPWLEGWPANGIIPYTSVTLSANGRWIPTDPRSPTYSICERLPCSATNYCQ